MRQTMRVGTRKGLFTLNRTGPGKPWAITQVDFLGVQVPMVLADPRSGKVYAAVGHGHFGSKLHRSDDGGRTFKEITAPAYPPKPADCADICPMRKIPIPWNVELIWSLEAGGADRPGELWLGTIPGGLFHAEDHGETWSLVESLWKRPERAEWMGGGYDYPGIHSILVDPRNPSRVSVGISCGGMWVTEDRGATWACKADGMRYAHFPEAMAGTPNTQDPHRIAACPAQPEVMWTQHHSTIFKTVDGGERWTEVPGLRFGFTVAVHPRKPETAWFVPAVKDETRVAINGAMSVSRTTDGGRTFEELRNGLPQEHAYDLVYRHGLDIDATGESLAMGSTTGSLWTSDNGGDTWQTISRNLPPIFCVRFA